jgi:hypothetical protein
MTARYARYRQPKRAALLLTVALAGSSVARAATTAQLVEISIPAGRAIDSVRALDQQANLNVLLSGRLADDVITNALNGSFIPADAVRQLVAGKPLAYAMADERTFTIYSCAEFRCAATDSIDSGAQSKGDHEAEGPSQRPVAQKPISD